MEGLTPSGFWTGGDAFTSQLDRYILHPHTHPDRYSDDPYSLFPYPRMIAIFGRGPSEVPGKQEAVEYYLQQRGITNYIPHETLFGETEVVVQVIQNTITDAQYHIINGCDLLVFDPESKGVMSFALSMQRLAIEKRVVFICLFDRIPSQPDGQMIGKVLQDYRLNFFNQFDRIRIYFPPPHAAARIQLFKMLIRTPNALTEDDYVRLGDMTSFTSASDIYKFLRLVFASSINSNESIPLDFATICRNAHNTPAGMHIFRESQTYLRTREEQYSSVVTGVVQEKRPEKRNKVENVVE